MRERLEQELTQQVRLAEVIASLDAAAVQPKSATAYHDDCEERQASKRRADRERPASRAGRENLLAFPAWPQRSWCLVAHTRLVRPAVAPAEKIQKIGLLDKAKDAVDKIVDVVPDLAPPDVDLPDVDGRKKSTTPCRLAGF
jgi:hypothetical protein